MLVLGTLLGLARLFHPLWGALLLTYAVLAYCVSNSKLRSRLRVPLILTALHTLLATVATVIEVASAWDDMNATMLVLLAIYVFDFPIHQAWRYIGLFPVERTAWYPTQLVLTGGLLWFTVGMILQSLVSIGRSLLRRK